ncbi:MAG: radical SAM protein [Planctomycetota bacterium]|jgi:wyosine [tRNA(Phe)-imidazoG37] synthetase (radical SAM superfamily)
MVAGKTYLYGPVPSRRLGLSLGIDVVPFKVCTLDCLYCQLGGTSEKTVERKDHVPIEAVLAKLKNRIAHGLKADHITVSGSGEPTLNSQLGHLINGIKQTTSIPAAVLTNGTLLYRADVRAECAQADVILPSLDAGDEETFERINRPHSDISIEKLINGLSTFRDEYAGQIWLEVFLIGGLNTGTEQIAKIKEAIEQIRPDKIQLNTAVRPTAQSNIRSLDANKLQAIARQLGPNAEVVADFTCPPGGRHMGRRAEDVLSMLKRRPCSLDDICRGLGIRAEEALKYIADFREQGVVDSIARDGIAFFNAKQP